LVSILSAAVPQGSPEAARKYYRSLATTLKFSNEASIFDSTLSDVPRYLGYSGISGRDLERISSNVLMDPQAIGKLCSPELTADGCDTAVDDLTAFNQNFGILPLRPNDILVSRFLAPKIANVSESAATRSLGWRKLVRLQARRQSDAEKNNIDAAIILFNFFTKPGEQPFARGAESVNTQVMLLKRRGTFRPGDNDALYWLDYGPLSAGGKLSLQLDATFDAADFQTSPQAVKPYFVPDGCVACHGSNGSRAMVNYLDTDHWFDRLENDFSRVRDQGLPVLFDGGTDVTQPDFLRAFDVIRRFNEEAEEQTSVASRNSFHRAAAQNWLALHRRTSDHIPTAERAIPSRIRWSPKSAQDTELLGLLNRYCFRCHGTITFNVFDKGEVFTRRAPMAMRLSPSPEQLAADPGFLMPPDRKLEPNERDRIRELLHAMEAR
jgi:hypothetical protein